MTRREIRIERIAIRMRGISAETARAVAAGLGREVIQQIGPHGGLRAGRAARIESIRLGGIQTARAAGAAQVRMAVGRAICDSVRSGAVGEAGD